MPEVPPEFPDQFERRDYPVESYYLSNEINQWAQPQVEAGEGKLASRKVE